MRVDEMRQIGLAAVVRRVRGDRVGDGYAEPGHAAMTILGPLSRLWRHDYH